MKRVLALDPGALVGWASAEIDDDGVWHNLEHGIDSLKDSAIQIAWDMGVDYAHHKFPIYDVIVVENWTLYRQHAEDYIGSDMPYSQYIGMIRLISWLADTKLVFYPAERKSHFLKSMGALRPELYDMVNKGLARAHRDSHDMDAIIHLWGYTFENFPVRRLANEG